MRRRVKSKFSSLSANSIEKAFDAVEADKNSTLSTISLKDRVKNAKVHYGMWVVLLFYVIVSYLLFAFSIGLHLATKYIGKLSHDQVQFIWTLYWWPFAISHNLNPLFTTYIWHPFGT